MEGAKNWHGQMKEMRELSIDELKAKLEEARANKFKLEQELHMGGHSARRYSYASDKVQLKGGNLKKLNKTIAFLLTIIEQKRNYAT